MTPPTLTTYPNARAAAEAAALLLADGLRAGLGARGRASLAAAGGRTPGLAYDVLAQADLDWTRVAVVPTDERLTAEDAPQSNARLLTERLLVGRAARALRLTLDDETALAAVTPFDAVLLGMGEDGHTASLFPGDASLDEGLDPQGTALRLRTAAAHGDPPLHRISLTSRALQGARILAVLISGPLKREVYFAAVAGADLPIRRVLAAAGGDVRVLWSP